jgi:hypothetical protein
MPRQLRHGSGGDDRRHLYENLNEEQVEAICEKIKEETPVRDPATNG